VLDSIFVIVSALVPSPSVAAFRAAIVGTHALSVLSNLILLFVDRYMCTTFLFDFPSPILLIVMPGCYFFPQTNVNTNETIKSYLMYNTINGNRFNDCLSLSLKKSLYNIYIYYYIIIYMKIFL